MSDKTDVCLYNVSELLELPPPTWLIEGILPEGDYSVLWGPSGQGKSFVALDWAVALALGVPWQGKYPVPQQRPVIYVAAEGGRGMQKRVRALMAKHGVTDILGLYFLIEPLYVREEGVVEGFIDTLEQEDINPGLIIIDTLSRSFGGGEENASQDMGDFIEKVTHIAKQRYMTALIVHHSNATGGHIRGHSALKCGANAMFQCQGIKTPAGLLQGVIVTNEKQKDEADAADIYLRVSPLRDSLVLDIDQLPEKETPNQKMAHAAAMRRQDMVRVLGAAEKLRWEEWRLASGGIKKSTFSQRVARLMGDGEVFLEDGYYYVYPANEDIE